MTLAAAGSTFNLLRQHSVPALGPAAASLLGPFEHEVAPPVARAAYRLLAFPYRVAIHLDPTVRPQKSHDLFLSYQIIQHVRGDDFFLTIGKNNGHACFLRSFNRL